MTEYLINIMLFINVIVIIYYFQVGSSCFWEGSEEEEEDAGWRITAASWQNWWQWVFKQTGRQQVRGRGQQLHKALGECSASACYHAVRSGR